MPRLYLPAQVKEAIREHVSAAIQRSVSGYWSAAEDEDALTSDLGSSLRISRQRVRVQDAELPGEWTWSMNYTKFRSKGPRATEKRLGADGIFEIQLRIGPRVDAKSLLFQAKTDHDRDRQRLFQQCVKLSTWREAAFVVSYSESSFRAITLDECLRRRGALSSEAAGVPLADILGGAFLNCLVGSTDLAYDPRMRSLSWRATTGEVVGTSFAVTHRIRTKVTAPKRSSPAGVDRMIKPDEIHNFRMETSDDALLSVDLTERTLDLKESQRQLALAYHPDRVSGLDELSRLIMNRRMQEINSALDRKRRR